jgi:hypothetical protein
MSLGEAVPAWLYHPPTSPVAPPIETLEQELPLSSLSWPDFERLCLRLVTQEADVVDARLYGTSGQDQHGIDLFARVHGTDRYHVYQAKRVEEFTPGVIQEAVRTFVTDIWAPRSSAFVLCTSDSLRTTQRLEEFERQRVFMSSRSIDLDVWDREKLSERLRPQAQIVYDFFGPAWVTVFCGQHALDQVHASGRRLTPDQVTTFRNRLCRLYESVFAANDPGLVAPDQETQLSLRHRYVVPDLLERRDIRAEGDLSDGWGERDPHDSLREDNPAIDLSENDLPEAPRYSRRPRRVPRQVVYAQQPRLLLEAFLSSNQSGRFVLLGGPGSGKSSLLRFLALDLLNDQARLPGIGAVWGDHLPVWIPFGGWVDYTDRAVRAVSLSEMVRDWLIQWNEPELWPLVEQALTDRRLLLLVDGLDEWGNEEAARLTLSQLIVFASQRDVPVILTSRPAGFQRLAAELATWRVAELAPLSSAQQVELSQTWFRKWLGSGPSSSARDASEESNWVANQAAHLARSLVLDLSRQPDLAELAAVPLLLCVLILLRYQQAALPEDRFRAYEALAQQLISVWPKRRKAAALVRSSASSRLRDEDREQAFAYLAYQVHGAVRGTLLDQGKARAYLEAYLLDENVGLASTLEEARLEARDLIDVGESISGILVKRSPRDIGFFHRSLQEFLAARYIASLPHDRQLAIVRARATDTTWRDVILALLWMTRSQGVVSALVNALQEVAQQQGLPERLHLAELVCEIAVGPFAVPPPQARAMLAEILHEVDSHWWMPHRERLLRTVLPGVRNPRVRPMLLEKLSQWYPERVRSRENLLRAVATWQEQDSALELLLRSVAYPEDSHGQLAAARLIAEGWKDSEGARDELRKLAVGHLGPRTRATALFGLMEGWGDHDFVSEVVSSAGSRMAPELNFMGMRVALAKGQRSDDLRMAILAPLASPMVIDYAWRDVVSGDVIAFFAGDTALRDICIRTVSRVVARQEEPRLDDRSVAWRILVEAFPQDEAVVEVLLQELESDTALLDWYGWPALAKNFGGNPKLAEAVDRWAVTSSQHREPLLATLALAVRSEECKKALLAGLQSSIPFWCARALLDGWGMGDPQAREHLIAKAMAANSEAQGIAHLLPRIIEDGQACYERLLSLLADLAVKRVDLVVRGLHELGRISGNGEVVALVLDRARRNTSDFDETMIGQTIIDAPDMPGVRDLAMEQLSSRDGAHAAVVHAFRGDAEVRQRAHLLLGGLPRGLRLIIPEFVRDQGFLDRSLVELCRSYDWDGDAGLATVGAIAHFRGLRLLGEVKETDVARLRAGIRSYGPFFHERRQASAAGLIELEQAKVLDEVFEGREVQSPVRVPLEGELRPNYPFVSMVVERWSDLEGTFPGGVLKRFSNEWSPERVPNMVALWEIVAPFADENPVVARRLLEFLEAASGQSIGPDSLGFLGRHRPRSGLLMDYCVQVIRRPAANWIRDPALWEVASDILAVQFGDQNELWEEFETNVRGDKILDGVIVALGRGRPESTGLSSIEERRPELVERMPGEVYARLICATWPADRLEEYLLERLGHLRPSWLSSYTVFYRPLVERLLRDRALSERLAHEAQKHDNVSLRGSLISVLSRVPGTLKDEALRALLASEISSPVSERVPPTLSYDLALGAVKPLSHILIETLRRGVA